MRKAKAITINGNEARAYEHLRGWAGRDAARFVLAVLNSRPVAGANPQK
jgi:hypothetical protein